MPGVEISKVINPHTKLEVIKDRSHPEDETKFNYIPVMGFDTDKKDPSIHRTKTMFLKPGDYRIKICMGPVIIWRTIRVGAYTWWSKTSTGQVDIKLDNFMNESRRITFARPVVYDRQTGEDITDKCEFAIVYVGKNHEDSETVTSLNGKRPLNADDVASLKKEDWVSDAYGEGGKNCAIVHVYAGCAGYEQEKFGLALDWYQDKVYINSSLEKKAAEKSEK